MAKLIPHPPHYSHNAKGPLDGFCPYSQPQNYHTISPRRTPKYLRRATAEMMTEFWVSARNLWDTLSDSQKAAWAPVARHWNLPTFVGWRKYNLFRLARLKPIQMFH
jgi:hypothetical protein